MVVPRREPLMPDEAVAGPLRNHAKHCESKAFLKMGITTMMTHFTAMDLQQQSVDLSPYKDFIHKKYGLV